MRPDLLEIETARGLEEICYDELTQHGLYHAEMSQAALQLPMTDDIIRVVLRLRSAAAAYRLLRYDIPRPKALLGHEHFHRLINAIRDHIDDRYQTLRISAAGSGSSLMTRLKRELSQHLNLAIDDDGGDLLLRIRRTSSGWHVLIRLTPRPLSARSWRVCDMPGAMNAPAAFALNALTHPQPHQTYVNLMAGSGTLLAERLALDLPGLYIASDIDTDALDCAARNLTGHPQARLMLMDATHTPLPDACADVICADLPFGQLVGSHAENLDLYPRFLQEAARIARPDARLGLLTHEINLMTRTLEAQSAWELEEERLISLRGLHPRILVLRREP